MMRELQLDEATIKVVVVHRQASISLSEPVLFLRQNFPYK